MEYDYYEQMKEDILEYLNYTNERDCDKLYEMLWAEDSVTGNGSGSYTFNTYKAEENLCHNLDLLKEALDEFGVDYEEAMSRGAEYCDTTIRCYLLPIALQEVLDTLKKEEN